MTSPGPWWHLSAEAWKKIHGIATVLWLLAIIPSLIWWRESVPWLVFMSVWANVGAHFGAWQAARAEDNNGSTP